MRLPKTKKVTVKPKLSELFKLARANKKRAAGYAALAVIVLVGLVLLLLANLAASSFYTAAKRYTDPSATTNLSIAGVVAAKSGANPSSPANQAASPSSLQANGKPIKPDKPTAAPLPFDAAIPAVEALPLPRLRFVPLGDILSSRYKQAKHASDSLPSLQKLILTGMKDADAVVAAKNNKAAFSYQLALWRYNTYQTNGTNQAALTTLETNILGVAQNYYDNLNENSLQTAYGSKQTMDFTNKVKQFIGYSQQAVSILGKSPFDANALAQVANQQYAVQGQIALGDLSLAVSSGRRIVPQQVTLDTGSLHLGSIASAATDFPLGDVLASYRNHYLLDGAKLE